MKKNFLFIFFICLSINTFAQRTNNRGECMVKSAVVESCGGRNFSYKLDFEYDSSNDLVKVTRSGYYENDKYVHVYTLCQEEEYEYEKYIRYIGYKNGKVFKTNKGKILCRLARIHYSLNGKPYNRYFVTNKDAYDDGGYHEMTNYIYDDGKLQAMHRGTNSTNNNEVVMMTWEVNRAIKGRIISDRLIGNSTNWNDDFVYYSELDVTNNTNLNINFIDMGGVGKTYKDENVGFTEWFGLNTTMALKGAKGDFESGSRSVKSHYEYELDRGLIKKIRYIHPIAGKEHDYIFKTITLEYFY